MNEKPVPYRRTIFVCTNSREEGGRPSCAKRGSEAICQALKDEIQKRGLKGKIRAMKSGCHDFCEDGPNIMIFPDGKMESNVSPNDVPSLIDKYL
jgi:NADH:ubiquinone oxidoreductase subunit E